MCLSFVDSVFCIGTFLCVVFAVYDVICDSSYSLGLGVLCLLLAVWCVCCVLCAVC